MSDFSERENKKDIEKVIELGIMEIYGDGNFYPDHHMTNSEVATVIVNLINYLEGSETKEDVKMEKEFEMPNMYEQNGFYYIEARPSEIYTSNFGGTLHGRGVYGINASWFEGSGTNPENAATIMINNGKALVDNAQFNGWNCPPRPIIYYANGKLQHEYVQSVNDLTTPMKNIVWGVGGGSLISSKRIKEKWETDVLRPTARRTGLAYKNGKVYLIATSNGMSLEIFEKRINTILDPEFSIFLDGGGSTQLNFKGKGVHSNRPVPNVIALK